MRLLVLGYSSIARRRVLPALAEDGSLTVDVASRRGLDAEAMDAPPSGEVFSSFEAALAESDADLVYVTTANHEHGDWVRQALESGRHVVVDKPAFLSLADTRAMLDLAAERNLCLAEATVYASHPQVAALRDLIAGRPVRRVNATFVFPPLPDDNFRNDPARGGGALYDLGPYAASICRELIPGAPVEITAQVTGRHPKTGVDTGFAMLASYADGAAVTGHFGFDGEYVNRVWANGTGWMGEIDRAFTPPPGVSCAVSWREANAATTVEAPAGDTFALFFRDLVAALRDGDWAAYGAAMAADAVFLDRLRRFSLSPEVTA